MIAASPLALSDPPCVRLNERTRRDARAAPANASRFAQALRRLCAAIGLPLLLIVLAALGLADTAQARTNVALNKTATQSSTYSPTATYAASNAVDGNWASVSSTTYEAQAWIQVDLAAVYNIDTIALVNRRDCCQDRLADFYVLVSDTAFGSTDLATARAQSGVSSYFFSGTAGERPTFVIGRTGRYVRVQLTGTNALNLAELQVYDSSGAFDMALSERGGRSSASSFYNGFPPSFANDGTRGGKGNPNYWNNDTANSFPNWWQVNFPLPQSINQVNVFTVADAAQQDITEPTTTQTFTTDGITAFAVQYWSGTTWVDVPGGNITGNNKVWTQISFSAISTDRIRVYVTAALANYSRIVEVEAVAATAKGLMNGSFELPALGVDYGTPAGSGWSFSGATASDNAGINKNGVGYTTGNPSAPEGAQVGFLQRAGAMTQTFQLPAGSYSLSFRAAQRGEYQYGVQIIEASIDGTVIGTREPSSSSYSTHKIQFTVGSSGAHTLRLAGVGSGGDYTALLDDVNITVAQPLTLVGYYRLDESAWSGAAGEVIDSSGGGHNGAGIGSPLPSFSADAPAIPQNPGTCSYPYFPGPSTGGGAFLISGLPLSTSAGDQASVSFWMYWQGQDDMFPLGWSDYYFWLAYNSLGFTTNGQRLYGVDWTGLANGWHHIAAVFSNSDEAGNAIYIDGVSQTLSQRSGGAALANPSVAGDLVIGGAAGRTDKRYRAGVIDEVRVYDGAITSAQVAADMTARHACTADSAPSGFNVFETSTAAAAITGVIHTKVSASTFTLDMVALNAGGTAVLPNFTGAVKIELLDVRDNSGALTGSCRSSWVPLAGSAPLTATFSGVNGRQTISLAESDAWRDVRVRVSFPATGTPTAVGCSTDDFAVRPSSLINLTATDATSTSVGTARALVNVAASGGIVHKAGQPFTLGATAVNSVSATTARYDGAPTPVLTACSGGACPTDWVYAAAENNNFTVSGRHLIRYGVAPYWNYLTLSGPVSCRNSQFGDPASGVAKHCDLNQLGTLALTSGAFASGVLNVGATYSEAGSFALQLVDSAFAAVDAADGSTLSERTVSSSVVNVGRFVPDHFELTSLAAPMLRTFDSSTCVARSFTYVGQPFGYVSAAQATVLARNVAGDTTSNYNGALWKIGNSNVTQSYATAPVSPTLDTSLVTAATLTSNNDGSGLLVGAAGDKIKFNRPASATVNPFNANLTLSWSVLDGAETGVTGNGSIITTTPLAFSGIAFDSGNAIRFGVLRLLPAYGSQLVDLPVRIEAQYWDGQRMALHTADQCTALPSATLAMSNYQRNLAACKTATAGALTLNGGGAFAKLTKPGTSSSGSVDLSLQLGATPSGQTCTAVGAGPGTAAATAALPWLQGKWNGASAFDQNPTTRASFGQYRSPLVLQREMY